MSDKGNYSDEEDEYEEEESIVWKIAVRNLPRADSQEQDKTDQREKRTVFTPFRALFSKEARRTYLGAILFLTTSIVLFCVAAVAYWVFYLNYVPQIGLKRVVHLQFG